MTLLDWIVSGVFVVAMIAALRVVWRSTFAPPADPQLHERRQEPGDWKDHEP